MESLVPDKPSLSFQCDVCHKSYSRKDVLTRHTKSQHQGPNNHGRQRRKSKRKSCLRCAMYRIKCTGGVACGNCEKVGLVCQYNFILCNDDKSEESDHLPREFQALLERSKAGNKIYDASRRDCEDVSMLELATSETRQPLPIDPSQTRTFLQDDSTSSTVWNNAERVGYGEADLVTSSIDIIERPFHQDAATPSDNDLLHISGLMHWSPGLVEDFYQTWPTENQPDYVKMLGDSLPSTTDQELAAGLRESSKTGLAPRTQKGQGCLNTALKKGVWSHEPHSRGGIESPNASDGMENSHINPWTAQAPSPTERQLDAVPEANARSGPSVRVPMADVPATELNQQLPIPQKVNTKSDHGTLEISSVDLSDVGRKLESIHQALPSKLGTNSNMCFLAATPCLDLASILSQLGINMVDSSNGSNVAPSVQESGQYWKAYSDFFHRDLPLIHKPSFLSTNRPPLVAAAVVAIGASYIPHERAQSCSEKVLTWFFSPSSGTSSTDSRIGDLIQGKASAVDLLAACLVLYHVLRSRDLRFFSKALREQERLDVADQVPQFHTSCTDPEDMEIDGRPDRGSDPWEDLTALLPSLARAFATGRSANTDIWARWSNSECRRRLAWGLTAVKCKASLVSNKPLHLTWDDMLYSPSSEALWEANSVFEWVKNFAWMSEPPEALPLSGLLSNLILSTVVMERLSPFTRALCTSLLEMALLDLTSGCGILDLSHWEGKGLTSRAKILTVLSRLGSANGGDARALL